MRNLSKTVRCLKTALTKKASDLVCAYRCSRTGSKIGTLHLLSCSVFAILGIYSFLLYEQMLDPSESSLYFDFSGTTPEDTSLWQKGCCVEPLNPFLFWKQFHARIANYVFLSQIVLTTGYTAVILSLLSVLLFLSYRHFRNLPRQRYNNPKIWDRLNGILCKWLPSIIRSSAKSLIPLALIPLYLTFVVDVCNSKIVEISHPKSRINNCRRWVSQCLEDHRRYGRHLQCSLETNYQFFPKEPCLATGECDFPVSKRTESEMSTMHEQWVVTLKGGICAGEYVPVALGGPLPRCPMCKEARDDPNFNLHNSKASKQEPSNSEAASDAVTVIPEKKKSLTPRMGPLPLFHNFEIPWDLYTTKSQAFYYSYMKVLSFFEEDTNAARMTKLWSTFCIFVCAAYLLAVKQVWNTSSLDGYFIILPGRQKGFFARKIERLKLLLDGAMRTMGNANMLTQQEKEKSH